MNKPKGHMNKPLSVLAIWCVSIMVLLAMPVAAVVSSPPAWAQSWTWPWETETRRAPEERPNPRYQPRYEPPQTSRGNTYDPRQPYGSRDASICLELEQQLARYANGTANRAQQIAELTRQIRESRGKLRNTQIQLDRQDCYEQFLFSRTLRRTRTCFNLDRSAIQLEREIQELELRYQQMQSTTARSHQDDIIRELARNNCGDTYVQEARRRNPMRSFWQDEDTTDERIRGNTFGGLPFATYRTLCVRLCDGYYFPVSFSTLPTHFTRDADACQSRCAAPTELYFHQNPGGSVAEMVSQKSQEPYKSLPTAFRYRKEYVAGCSCKQAEYVPGNDGTAPRRSGATQPHQSPRAATDTPQRSALSPVR
jgi:hypothetical protein